MDFTPIKLWLIVMSVVLSHYGNSVAEEVKLENRIKLLNRTPIKTIRTEEGDVFDCIDINKQPSLDHPLLKNHVIKTKPIPHSNTILAHKDDDDDHETTSSSSSSKIAILRKIDCPDETIPIRRTSKEDLERAKSFSKSLSTITNTDNQLNDLESPGQGEILSIAKTRKDSGINYIGIAANINVYNPSVTKDQVSAAQLWIENRQEEVFNSLQAGWIVAPSLYGDNKTRFFGKWQVDDSNKSEGCYDIFCPGFVAVDRAISIGTVISVTSEFGAETQYEMKVAISKDGEGNWWLEVNDINVGYWPVELGFSQLSGGSPIIAWGGLAAESGTITTTTIPPTGNGHYPNLERDFKRQCFMRVMKVIPITSMNWEDPTRQIIDTIKTKTQCSDIVYYGRYKRFYWKYGYRVDFGHTLAFGGPGGNCQ